MSPRTIWVLSRSGISTSFPSRTTEEVGCDIFAMAARALFALFTV